MAQRPPGIVAYRRRRPGNDHVGIGYARAGEAFRFENRPDENLLAAEDPRQPLPEGRGNDVGQRQIAIREGGRKSLEKFAVQAPREFGKPAIDDGAHAARQNAWSQRTLRRIAELISPTML